MLNKHKLFLLCAKWIPVVTAIGILVTNTIAYYGCNDIVVDIFNFNIGTSVAGVILKIILDQIMKLLGILFADLKILQKIKMIKIMKCFGV